MVGDFWRVVHACSFLRTPARKDSEKEAGSATVPLATKWACPEVLCPPPQTSKGPKTTGARPTTGPDTPNTAQGSAKWTLGEPLSETPKSPRRPREAVSHTPPFFSTEWACLEVICRIPTGPETPAAWTQTAHETLEPARGSAIDPWASPRVTPNRAQRPKHSRHPFPHACIQRNKGVGGVA